MSIRDPRRNESDAPFDRSERDRSARGGKREADAASALASEPETRAPARRQTRYAMLLDALLASLLASVALVAASPLARHWIGVIVSNVCILGGIVAAPVVSMVAWIGLVLPTHALLHQIAPALVAASLVWFFLAIVGAHALRLDERKPE